MKDFVKAAAIRAVRTIEGSIMNVELEKLRRAMFG